MKRSLFVVAALVVGVAAVHAQKNKPPPPPPTPTVSALSVVDSLGHTVGTTNDRQFALNPEPRWHAQWL
jgi:hypothetical protein